MFGLSTLIVLVGVIGAVIVLVCTFSIMLINDRCRRTRDWEGNKKAVERVKKWTFIGTVLCLLSIAAYALFVPS